VRNAVKTSVISGWVVSGGGVVGGGGGDLLTKGRYISVAQFDGERRYALLLQHERFQSTGSSSTVFRLETQSVDYRNRCSWSQQRLRREPYVRVVTRSARKMWIRHRKVKQRKVRHVGRRKKNGIVEESKNIGQNRHRKRRKIKKGRQAYRQIDR
jgi:hypothetical protein